jgi:crossover junction endodeoxyribonuclease RusA
VTEYRIDLPWSRPPLSLNDKGMHWAVKARKVREVREAAARLIRGARIGRHDRVQVRLHYQPATNRRADPANLLGTQKPCLDGLVDAGVIVDDSPKFVDELMPKIHPAVKGEPGKTWLVVTVLDETKEAS